VTRAVTRSMLERAPQGASLYANFREAFRTILANAHLVLGISLVWLASAAPIVAAVMLGTSALTLMAILPFLLATSGAYRALARVMEGTPRPTRAVAAMDPLLAGIAWAACVAVVVLAGAGEVGVVVSSVAGAVWVLVLPLAFGYGAVRERRGLGALRGGVVLALLRPDLAITSAALHVLGAFAVVASAGALWLCVPALVALFVAHAVAAELSRYDAAIASESSPHA
jgi:hypothetical protein